MTDICKCNNENCSIRQLCFRYRAAASEYQAFFVIDKTVESEADCDNFWNIENEEHLKELQRYWAD